MRRALNRPGKFTIELKATDQVANKVAKGFNITDIPMEFGLLVEEVGEAFSAWRKQKPGLGGELADVAIFLLGLAEMTGNDLGAEVEAKLAANGNPPRGQCSGTATPRGRNDTSHPWTCL